LADSVAGTIRYRSFLSVCITAHGFSFNALSIKDRNLLARSQERFVHNSIQITINLPDSASESPHVIKIGS
jgi:hypothetical protein